MRRFLLAAVLALVPGLALAQGGPVQQSGQITPGQVPVWVTNGVVGNGGPALEGKIKELGITNTGTPFCVTDGPRTGPYHQLCFGARTGAPTGQQNGLISYQAYGGAAPLQLLCNVNGVTQPCFGGGNVVFSATAPPAPSTGEIWVNTTNGQLAIWDGTKWWYEDGAVTVSATAPANPVTGCLWYDTTTGQLKLWTGSAWVAISGGTQTSYDVRLWNAKCDGSTDDTLALQAALDAYPALNLPSATCMVSGTLTVKFDGASIVGNGHMSSVIKNTSGTATTLVVPANVGAVTLSDFTLDRTVAAGTNANGFDLLAGPFRAILSRLRSTNNWIGFVLGPTPISVCQWCYAEQNFSDGFFLTNTAANQTVQWELNHTLSQGNNGLGYNVLAQPNTVMNLMAWHDPQSFANTLGGAHFIGVVAGASHGVVAGPAIHGGVFSTDGNTEVELDTYSENAKFFNTHIELAGTEPTGRGRATPASHIGHGVHATGNNSLVQMNGVDILSNSQHGILTGAFRTTLTGSWVVVNGVSTPGTYNGVYVDQLPTGGKFTAIGNMIGNVNAYGTAQANGIGLADGSQGIIVGNDLCYNTISGFQVGSNVGVSDVHSNDCYVTENSGEGIIPTGQTSQVITHGLAGRPVTVQLTPEADPHNVTYWFDSANGTNFTVHLSSPAVADLPYAWNAKLYFQ